MSPVRTVPIGPLLIGGGQRLVLIAGPCVIESAAHALQMAAAIKTITAKHQMACVYKASFDKANRTSLGSFRGPGLDEGLAVLRRVKEETGLPVLTDIHEPAQAGPAARVADALQIPAFLSRQTDLIVAAARTGCTVNIKKGQFLAPHDVEHAVEKVLASGNERVFVTERGFAFGYNNLVVDMRVFPIVHELGLPIVYDVTHSLQLPGGAGHASGGLPQYIEPLALAGVAAGADGIFVEVHDNPAAAKSDGLNALPLARLDALVERLLRVEAAVRPATRATVAP
jgi:2-dehydro-3-deoxyphosphooctonate aldolase (KDO 8-P synthase)